MYYKWFITLAMKRTYLSSLGVLHFFRLGGGFPLAMDLWDPPEDPKRVRLLLLRPLLVVMTMAGVCVLTVWHFRQIAPVGKDI